MGQMMNAKENELYNDKEKPITCDCKIVILPVFY